MTYETARKARRWEKFSFSEWRSDERLSRCSRGARSLWLDMCGLIYAGGDPGARLIVNGKPPTDQDLARMFGDDPRSIRKWLSELKVHGVYDEDHENFIVSRRILRENLRREIDANNGRLGGNPALVSKDKQNEGVKAKRQEARAKSVEGLAGLVSRGLTRLGPGAVDHRTDPAPRKSLEALLPEWLERWDFDLDILPVLEAQTKRHRPRPLRYLTRLSEDIAAHHEARTGGQFGARTQNSEAQNSKLPKFLEQPLSFPDGQAGEALRAVVGRKGADWARKWMADVAWNGTEVYAPSEYARQRIEGDVGHILRDHGYDRVVCAPDA